VIEFFPREIFIWRPRLMEDHDIPRDMPFQAIIILKIGLYKLDKHS